MSAKKTQQAPAEGKRLYAKRAIVERNKFYSLEEAVKLLKETKSAKFDETVEVNISLGVDPRKSDQIVRGVVGMPHGVGKTIRIAVFARGDKAEEAKKAGADIVGAEELADEIQKGNIDFDRCIATPDMMAVVGRIGKILGPRGLMPNPKLGTVTPNVKEAVEAAKSGQVEFRAEKAGIVHAGIGKSSFDEAKIKDNLVAFIDAVNKAKPASVKGTYMKKLGVSLTMGPGIKIDLSSLAA